MNPEGKEAFIHIVVPVLILGILVVIFGSFFIITMINRYINSKKMQKTGFFCPNCGTPFSQNANFCMKCGQKLKNESST